MTFARICAGLTVLGLAASGIIAQDRLADPVPFWPEANRIPANSSEQYVFLTRDKHTIVVLVPENREMGLTGPKKIIKVPIRNDLAPSVSAQVARAPSGNFTYQYTIQNRPSAKDAIGAFTLIVPPSDPNLEVRGLVSNGEASWRGAAPHGPPIAKQAVFPDAPLGRYLIWFKQDGKVIQAGGILGGFATQSSYLPGLTTAWFSSGQLVELDQSWPREVFKQLDLLEDRRYREVYAITIGPAFPPQTAKLQIVAELQQQLEELMKAGVLDRSSPFAQEVVKILREFHQNPEQQGVLKSRPQNATESAIAAVLRESVDIR